MDRRTLLGGLLALAPAAVLSKPRTKGKKRKTRRMATPNAIQITDYTGPQWSGHVAAMVEAFNAVMPAGAPLITYVHREWVCPESIIRTCEKPLVNIAGQASWDNVQNPRGGSGDISLTDTTGGWTTTNYRNVVCHEFMHILGDIHWDAYNTDEESCIFGNLPYPGATDVARLAKVWG